MDPTTISLFLAATLASLFMAWVIGAGSSGATPFAPAVGANAISTMRAAFVVGILTFAGAVAQGGSVSEAVGRGLVTGIELPASAVIVVLVLGASLMAIGIQTGYPIATAFSVTGAVIGIGLALGGGPAWQKYVEVGAVWTLTPFVGGGIAYAIASVLPRSKVPEAASVPLLAALVAGVVANLQFAFLGTGDGGSSIAAVVGRVAGHVEPMALAAVSGALAVLVAGAVRADILRDETGGLRRFLLALGGLVAFSAGASQVGLAVGPLLPLLDDVGFVAPTAVLVGGGFGMLVGSWTGAPRMIKSLARDYSALGPRRSIAALVPSFLIAQTAVLLGVPVSFNEIVVSAIVGSGLAVGGGAGVSRKKLLRTVLAWPGSFVLALTTGYGAATVLPI